VPLTRASRGRLRGLATALLVLLAVPASAAARPSVVGGSAAPPGSWPYAALVVADLGTDGTGLCTGVVIAPTAVLTAGHCALDDQGNPLAPRLLTVVTGRLQWNDETAGQALGVAQVAVDPGYDGATGKSDVAVLQLAEPTAAPPIRLATDADMAAVKPGSSVAIGGFGQTISGQSDPQYQLMQGSMTLMAASACTVIYRDFDSASQLCVDSPGHTTEACHGDSGGPLVATLASGEPVLLGVTEGGIDPCGSAPSIYTAVTPALPFIDPLIGVAPPPGPHRPENTRKPIVLTHAGRAGRLLCKIGAWDNRPTDYTYAWYWNGRKQSLRSKAVVVPKRAGGGWMRCAVTAVNAGGKTTVRSAAVHVER
jgi:secreted trypsin-like serine protease